MARGYTIETKQAAVAIIQWEFYRSSQDAIYRFKYAYTFRFDESAQNTVWEVAKDEIYKETGYMPEPEEFEIEFEPQYTVNYEDEEYTFSFALVDRMDLMTGR